MRSSTRPTTVRGTARAGTGDALLAAECPRDSTPSGVRGIVVSVDGPDASSELIELGAAPAQPRTTVVTGANGEAA